MADPISDKARVLLQQRKGANRQINEADGSTVKKAAKAEEHNLISPTKTAGNQMLMSYNPRALLNPRGARKPGAREKSETPADNVVNPSKAAEVNARGAGSMLEAFHGLQHRAERPAKRVKVDALDEDNKSKPSTFKSTHKSGGGIVGSYLKPSAHNLTADLVRDLVDLTNEDDPYDNDDDLQVIKTVNLANEQEVCFGMIYTDVHAHAIPATSGKSQFTLPTQWPVIRCTLIRATQDDTVIEVQDPESITFGKVATDVARVLAPILDSMRKIRTQARLTNRPRKASEKVHDSCSARMRLMINIYGRRGDAERIGKVFGQHNIWFKNPMGAESGYETCNPHASRAPMVVPPTASRHNQFTSDMRTIEEATQAVSKVFDHFANTAKPLAETEANSIIITPLLSHQKQALTFMLRQEQLRTYGNSEEENSSLWRKKFRPNGAKVYEEVVTGLTVRDEPTQVYGGLLADVMGLGKTLEAISLIANTLDEARQFAVQKPDTSDADSATIVVQSAATLIVAPLSTVKNWEDQIAEHVEPGAIKFHVYHGPTRERDPQILAEADIIISTYGTIASEFSKKAITISPIRQVRWFRIILDEAHTIREPKATQSQAMYSIQAQRRWCLTGTPIQNRIDDLGSLTRFLRLYPYDTAMRFNQYIRAPAVSGDANFLKALRIFVDSFTLRRLKDRIDLPKRQNLVEKLNFTKEEQKLHDFFKEVSRAQIERVTVQTTSSAKSPAVQHSQVLRSIMTLRLISAHGRELLKERDLEKLKGQTPSDAIDLEDDSTTPALTKRAAYESLSLMAEAGIDMCRQCDKTITGNVMDSEEDEDDNARAYVLPCLDIVCPDCFAPHKPVFDEAAINAELLCPYCSTRMPATYVPIDKSIAEVLDTAPEDTVADLDKGYTRGQYTGPHTKTKALLRDLAEMHQDSKALVANGETPIKCVVFSEFTSHLDLLERALSDNGYRFVRIDGTMSLSQRKRVLDELDNNNKVTILLASIKAAGQGLNLTAASRAFIMEPLWNPAAETQAVDRIYRIGQKREVIIKRYQMLKSIELKIVTLQEKKQKLADLSMNKNHQALSRKEIRAEHIKDLLDLFK